ncbi:MAG: hypothetical protein FJ029_14350, partial [Actinobacteria bacterium]|nr:hypothetical protein [Actinomycetota bacterium]
PAVTQAVAVQPAAQLVPIRIRNKWTSGARGKAMQWMLASFAKKRPDILVQFEPGEAETTGEHQIHFAAGTVAEVALISGPGFLQFRPYLVDVTDLLAKAGVNYEDYLFIPDHYSDNKIDHSFPAPQIMTGPQMGMPFQGSINGFLANTTLAEKLGVPLPSSEGSWTWDNWSEWDKKFTDPAAGTYGGWARNDPQFFYWPQLYTNGLKKYVNDALTKTMWDLPEVVEAYKYLLDKIFVHKVSPPAEAAKQLSAEFGDPFSSGKVGIVASGQVYGTGNLLPRIGEKFKWTLLPAVTARQGTAPGHSWNIQPHVITLSAQRRGTVEQATALAMYFAGEEVQTRTGIDRGHMPIHKKALQAATSVAPPPDGMKWLVAYGLRPDKRQLVGWNTWEEWYSGHNAIADKAFVGQQTAEQNIAAMQAYGAKILGAYDGPKPTVKAPVYP